MTTAAADRPLSEPTARPVVVPVLLWIAGTLAIALYVAWLGVPRNAGVLGAVTASVNVLTAAFLLQRARVPSSESTGWYLLMWAHLLVAGANVVGTLEVWHPKVVGPWRSNMFVPALVAQGLVVGTFVVWPWRPWKNRRRLLHAIGAAMFVGSFLLFLWLLGGLSPGDASRYVTTRSALIFVSVRVSLVGGVALYILAEDPRRVRGVLGWILLTMLLGAAYIALLRAAFDIGRNLVHPFFTVGATAPFALAIGAWAGVPVEAERDSTATTATRGWEVLPYVPFVLAGVTMLVTGLEVGHVDIGVALAFSGLTFLLVVRQFLLLRELRRSKAELEERVAERTRKMESLQAIVVRTERLNTFAALGAGLTHDINNLLTAIQASVGLMRAEVARGGQPQERTVARIVETSERAGGLARKVMSFAGHSGAPVVTKPAGEVLDSMRDLLRLFLPRGIELVLDVDAAAAGVPVDAPSLEQVLVNLVSNARDAIEGGKGRVTVRLRSGETRDGRIAVLVEVVDTGVGMTDDVRARLFEPFFTTKASGRGTGLGLPSVKALVEQQGGSVDVESEPGKGTRFVVRYPKAEVS